MKSNLEEGNNVRLIYLDVMSKLLDYNFLLKNVKLHKIVIFSMKMNEL